LTALVLDASIAVSWCFEETQTPYSIALLGLISEGTEVHVPHLWPLEVTNALVKALRRQQITREELSEYARQLASLRVQVDIDQVARRAFHQVLLIAERYQLTTYNAAYLELAQRRKLPLATADRNLVQAAGATKVEVFKP
jgi:predicted nucleic acid-binding protein